MNSQTMPLLSPAINLDPNPAKGGGDVTIVDGSALLSQEGPSGTSADLEEKAQSTQISVHVVKEGETISHIAELYDVSVNTIRWANDIQRGDVVHPGDELIILPVNGIKHEVLKGETLASIAKKYGGDLNEIASYNDLAVDTSLATGQEVIIPDGVIAAAAPAKTTTSAPARASVSTGTTVKSSGGGYSNPFPGSIKTQGIHGQNGVDLSGLGMGSPVVAAAAGEVIVAKSSGWNGGYGIYVVVQHSNGTQTLYAHLSSVSVGAGQRVEPGTKIGGVGNTGRSTGVHLHFEVRGATNPF